VFGDERLVGGAYCNGGIMPLVGGELARAAFDHGFEAYGVDILRRYFALASEKGESYLWYFRTAPRAARRPARARTPPPPTAGARAPCSGRSPKASLASSTVDADSIERTSARAGPPRRSRRPR